MIQRKPRTKTRRVPHRRRRQQKTDYRKRLILLKSGRPRLVVRRSSNNITCQIVRHETGGDRTLVSINSNDLKKLGWSGHPGNLPSAYLAGLLCGVRARSQNIKDAVLDVGFQTPIRGSCLYSTLKGAVDAGINIPHSDDVFPPEDRISGEHVAKYSADLRAARPDDYRKRFSAYLKNKLNPEDLPRHFSEIKERILSAQKTTIKTEAKKAEIKQPKSKRAEAKTTKKEQADKNKK